MIVRINNVDVSQNVLQGSISITNKSNGVRSCSVSLWGSLQVFRDGDDLKVYDGTTVLFGGIIKSFSTKMVTPISDDIPIIETNLQSDGYNYIPNRRVVNTSYSNVTAGSIVQAMVGPNALGSDYITAGTIETGPTLTSYVANYKTIKEVLDDMAKVAANVWYIDNERRLQFVNEQTVVNSEYELVKDGPFTDFHGLSWSGGLDNYANRVYIIGGNNASGTQIIINQSNTDEITIRQNEAGGYSSGVYGTILKDSNITSVGSANTVAFNHLKKYAISPSSLSFSSYSPNWKAGSKLKVQIPQITGFSIASGANTWYYLIEEVQIEREDAATIRYSVSATRRNELNFSTQKTEGFKEYFETIIKK